ncbi:hypothetical protein P7C71_g375, partial [Lecanoromycetidae sp. Uapishka_2]
MSVETLGADLLREVKEEGLDELLRTLREVETPSTSLLGFAPLDRLLDVFQNPPQTRQQQQYHTQYGEHSTQHPNLHSTKEKLLPVIEIEGATACSGKTQLLCYLLSLTISGSMKLRTTRPSILSTVFMLQSVTVQHSLELKWYSRKCGSIRIPEVNDDELSILTKSLDLDLKIICEGVEMPVHKNVVLAQSKPLKAMFNHDFKESKDNTIRIKDDSIDAVTCMVEYFYRSDYPELNREEYFAYWEGTPSSGGEERFIAEANFDEDRLHHHISVFVLADKYDIPGLGQLATKKYTRILDVWQGMRFLNTIPTIYETPTGHNSGLRKAVAAHTRARWYMFNSANEVETKKRLEELIATIPEFAVDFLQCWLGIGYHDICTQCGDEVGARANMCRSCSIVRSRHQRYSDLCSGCGEELEAQYNVRPGSPVDECRNCRGQQEAAEWDDSLFN